MDKITFDETTIDWTKAPYGYDYYIVDKQKIQVAEFHKRSIVRYGDEVYEDVEGSQWDVDSDRITVYQRPEGVRYNLLPELPFKAYNTADPDIEYTVSFAADDALRIGWSGHPNIESTTLTTREVIANLDEGSWTLIPERVEVTPEPVPIKENPMTTEEIKLVEVAKVVGGLFITGNGEFSLECPVSGGERVFTETGKLFEYAELLGKLKNFK